MAQDNRLVQTGFQAVKSKDEDAKMWGANNQYRIEMSDGRIAAVKTGSKGTVMQLTDGSEIESDYIGIGDADSVVIAVRENPSAPINVYKVPSDVYRDRMTQEYTDRCKVKRLKPTNLRVLRFDEKGYPFQRVAEEWERYRIEYEPDPDPSISTPAEPSVDTSTGDRELVISSAKAMVAQAYGVSSDKVSISVNF